MKKNSTIKRLTQEKAFPLLIILIVLMFITMIISTKRMGLPLSDMFTSGFMASANILTLLNSMVIMIFMMIGLSCILISGNIDLSIAGQATLGTLIFAKICQGTEMHWIIAVIITLVFACAFGLINTFLVNVLKFPAFIATIGMSSIYGGLCNVITGGNNIQINRQGFIAIGSANVGGYLPVAFIVAIVILVIFQLMLSYTRFGRSIFMSGGNPVAARLSGLNPNKMRLTMFLINSIMSVIGGLLWSAQIKLASPTSIIASAPNMTATSAAVLGGVSFFGGSGHLVGPLIAILLINVFENMLNVLGINQYVVVLAQGVLLLVALIIDYMSAAKKKKEMLAAAAAA